MANEGLFLLAGQQGAAIDLMRGVDYNDAILRAFSKASVFTTVWRPCQAETINSQNLFATQQERDAVHDRVKLALNEMTKAVHNAQRTLQRAGAFSLEDRCHEIHVHQKGWEGSFKSTIARCIFY